MANVSRFGSTSFRLHEVHFLLVLNYFYDLFVLGILEALILVSHERSYIFPIVERARQFVLDWRRRAILDALNAICVNLVVNAHRAIWTPRPLLRPRLQRRLIDRLLVLRAEQRAINPKTLIHLVDPRLRI